MNFLQPYFIPAILVALVPVLIHLLKHQTAKKVLVNSLWMLRHNAASNPRRLRLKQLLLLLIRISLALALAVFFLKPVIPSAPQWLANSLPHRSQTQILLDTTADDRETLLRLAAGVMGTGAEVEVLSRTDILSRGLFHAAVSRKAAHQETILVSRFYGMKDEDISSLQKQGFILFPVGPDALDTAFVSELRMEPDRPFPGEPVRFWGTVRGPAETALTLRIKTDLGLEITETSVVTGADGQGAFVVQGVFTDGRKTDLTVLLYSGQRQQQLLTLSVEVRRPLVVGLIDDKESPSKAGSRLYIVHEFLQSLNQMIRPTAPILIQTMDSTRALEQIRQLDLVIAGNLRQPLRIPSDQQALIFYQPDSAIQAVFNESLGITTYEIDREPRELQFLPRHPQDRGLIDRTFPIRHSLRFRTASAEVLASTGLDPLIIRTGRHVFSGIDLHPDRFPELNHPYIPVFLYRLLLQRDQEDKTLVMADNTSRSRPEITTGDSHDSPHARADLSPVFLSFTLVFFLLEAGLILSLQRS